MKKILFLLLLVSSAGFGQFVTPPKVLPHSFVQDYEHVLTSEQVLKLNQQIDTITHHFSAQIAVIILSDLQGYEIEEAALNIGRDWGVGLKDTNNGIVYLISPKLHKARLEVGYGLEGNIPDITAQMIGDGATSFYKKGDWYGGIEHVLTQVNKQLDQKTEEESSGNSGVWFVVLCLVALLVYIAIAVYRYFKKRPEYGVFTDENMEPYTIPPPPPMSHNDYVAPAAFVAGAALSKNDDDDSSSSYSSSSSDDDDDSFGGSSFGSSSSDSDFGSFGGGSFGGGGATSGW